MKTLVIIGSEGQLGQCFRHVLADSKQFKLHYSTKLDCDINKLESTTKHLQALQPDVVINCAAYTQVDTAEVNQQQAVNVNILGVENLVMIAKKLGFSIVHFSTDYVFDGKQTTPYVETAPTNALSVYGQTKLRGETALFKATTPHCCIRSSWLYSPFGNNFVKTIREKLLQQEALQVVNDQYARPTYGIDLAKTVVQMLQNNTLMHYPLYHFANKGETSWFGIAQHIATKLPSNTRITAISTTSLKNTAPRPKYSVLATERIEKIGNFSPRGWEATIDDCLKLINEIH
jgi:dTDP-4-dehydrorhamnose reductase